MGNQVVMNPVAAQAATKVIGSASDDADKSASYTTFTAYQQTTSKWGEESGPTGFQSAYSQQLSDVSDELMKIKSDLVEFETTMAQVIKEFAHDDSAAAQRFTSAHRQSLRTPAEKGAIPGAVWHQMMRRERALMRNLMSAI